MHANRIKFYLPDIIHHNQSGFVKDRFIGETTHSILDITYLTTQNALNCQEWCSLLTSKKHLTRSNDFDISNSLEEIYSLDQTVASETYIWSFQYRVLNCVLYTNAKLFKTGLSLNDKCTFCGSSKEELNHLFFPMLPCANLLENILLVVWTLLLQKT